MAEIKSTRDLIMERTRHLTLSEEEKESLRVQALAGHIKAVMRRFFSEAQPIDEVVDELFSLSSDLTLLKELIGRELIESLDPREDYEPWLKLFRRTVSDDTAQLQALITSFLTEIGQINQRRAQELIHHLLKAALPVRPFSPIFSTMPPFSMPCKNGYVNFGKK